ncbi:hypothetical protein [Stenotrophomonas sp. CFBP8980]|uniref:hypothetical protein n=1 Tax=Stenotrophomonas sp. CFBP8980 TaxID=3096523 RepID=UPI002A6A8236|nr:hypothetical protein [Stenotrophomonas sp. CFBP8980]MDY1033990.1 hypothetical protein [Stenotrophomonas sp. CFBP8980]
MKGIKMLGTEPVDGRPLYRYRAGLWALSALEASINNPLVSRKIQVQALAPVAAARFASNYDGGSPSWNHCGEEILRLYNRNGARFRELMDESFSFYRIPVVSRPGADLLLETVIGQAGLPSGMIRQGKPIRKILDSLMQHEVAGGVDAQATAQALIGAADARSDLRKAHEHTEHLPGLCVDLVRAVLKLTTDAQWEGGALDRIWSMPGWMQALPFRVEEDAAKEIVGHLLNVALAATEGAACAIERIISRRHGAWTLNTRAMIDGTGFEAAGEVPGLVAVHYAIAGEPVGEAFKARRKDGGRFFQASAVQDLSENVSDRAVSLVISDAGTYRRLDCIGGEPLDERCVWVFEPGDGDPVYRSPAPVRLRTRTLLAAAPEGTIVTGEATALGEKLMVNGSARPLWSVSGKAVFTAADGDFAVVESGYAGPQGYLDFSGRTPHFRVKGYSTVFVGDANPRKLGGLSGRIEWRRAGDSAWLGQSARGASGDMQFRLVDDTSAVIAERRRVLVLPQGFDHRTTNRHLSLSLPAGVTIAGHATAADGTCTIKFAGSSLLTVTLLFAGTRADLLFECPKPASFIDLASGEETATGMRRVSSIAAGRIVAQAGTALHNRLEVRRASASWNAVHSLSLRANRLPLSEVSGFLEALSFDPRARTHALKVQFPNGPGIEIEPYRIRRIGAEVTVEGASDDVRVQLRELTHVTGDEPIELQRKYSQAWLLPDAKLFPGVYLAIDPSRQAAPCLVVLGEDQADTASEFLQAVGISESHARSAALIGLYRRITDDPHSGKSSAELDVLLGWLGSFQFYLRWLDPFLVLAKEPLLALRLLALARLRGYTEAEQGLRWGLDGLPFFWHAALAQASAELLEWSRRQFGESQTTDVSCLLASLPLAGRVGELVKLRAAFGPWSDAWQTSVGEWSDRRQQELEFRDPPVRDAAAELWERLSVPGLVDTLRTRSRSITPSVDLDRTFLLAPYELAVATWYRHDMDQSLRDNLLFARYMIDPMLFDDAYCSAIAMLENAA